jgi:multicomponent Na+:H+ antiporter subunit D
VPLLGAIFLVGGVLLAAPPPFTEFQGKALVESAADGSGHGWLLAVFLFVSAMTSAAVLRVTGRVFLGWGPAEGPDPGQARAARERVDETRDERDHTPFTMIAVPAVLLLGSAVAGIVPGAVPWVARAATKFVDHRAYAAWVLHGRVPTWPATPSSHVEAIDVVLGLGGCLGAAGLAALGLFGRDLSSRVPARMRARGTAAVIGLRHLHSGHIGDYIAWWTAGAALLGGTCLIALR